MLKHVIDDLAAEYNLTPRQREVLVLLLTGADRKEVSEKLVISEVTAKEHIHAILSRTNMGSRTRLLGQVIRRLDALSNRTAPAAR